MPNNENKMNDQVDNSGIQEVTQPIGDLHICGACKAQFHDIDIFILHKRQACMGNHSNNQGPSGNYGNNSEPQHNQKHSNNFYMNNNNNDDQAMMDHDVHHETQVDEEDVQDHGAEVSLTTSGGCETTTEEVVFIEVPQDTGGQISQQGMDGGSHGIVSLQNALMSNQSGEVTIINQSGCLEGADSAVQVVQQLLRSPSMTSHGLEEYGSSPSLLQVLQGGVSGVGVSGVEVTATNSQELQLDGAHTDVISKGLKKVTLNKKFRCDQVDCGFTTAYQKDLDRHRRIHTGERPFACHICDKDFNRADKLKVHIRGHAGNKPYSCPDCNYATSDSSSLKKHLRIHSDERPFKCQICQYASRNSSQLIVHLRTHTGDSPFQCQLCSAKFKINSDLKRHVRLHTGEKPYRCEHCDYRCAIKGNLRTHYKINHSTDRVLVCDTCEFSTSSPRALREHVKSHDTYEMTYRCPICKYTCASRTTLKVHLRVHSNDRPYKCRFCSFSSKQSGNVGTHMRRKHMDMLWSSVGKLIKREGDKGNTKDKKNANRLRPVVKKPFKCSKCDASFVRQDSLRSHVRHHKEVERDLAQKLENTVQAVLQLSTPVNLDPKRARPEDPQSSNGQQVSEAHHHVGSIEDLVVEEVIAAPVITVSTEETPRHHNTNNNSNTTTTVTTTAAATPSPARRPQASRAPSHSYNQVVSNRLAFAQNNQNQAIEENFQNNVMNSRRMAAAAAAAAASTADKPTISTTSTISSASQSSHIKHPTAVASTAVITNNGSVPVVSQARLVRVVGQGQQKLTPVVYQTVSKPSRILPTANRPLVARTVRPQGTQLVQAVKLKQEQHQQQHQQQLTVATATHQQSCLPQQHNTVTTSHPLLQHQLATANSQQVVQHQVSTHDPKPVQVTFQVPQSLTQTVSPLTSTTGTSTMQMVAPQVRSQQVLSAQTLVNIQQQQQQQHQQQHQQQQQQQQQQQIVHSGGTPVSFQIVQNGSAGSSLLPQQVQVLLPASAFTHASTTGVQVAQPGQYQQQVILQVPAGAEGLLDSSGQFQIPVPLRFLPTPQQQVIRLPQASQQQQQQHAQQQLPQSQVITLQGGPVQQQQQQQHVDVQQMQQQQQVLQQQQMQLQAQIQHQANTVYSHKKQV